MSITKSWAAVFNVNTMGPLRVTEAFIDQLSLTPEESVTALKRLIETLGSAESGKFFDYDGREHAL